MSDSEVSNDWSLPSRRPLPDIVADPEKPTAWVEPDPKQPLLFRAVGQSQPLNLVPLYQIIPERYAVYWKVHKKTA